MMTRFKVHSTAGDQVVQAEDWDVQGDLLIFYSKTAGKVFAIKASSVVTVEDIDYRPERDNPVEEAASIN